MSLEFLSREFCLIYALDILKLRGTWHLFVRKYAGMTKLRIDIFVL